MSKGYLAVVLHAHLPYVRHPEYASFLEERWLFEAITETYIPLIRVIDRLQTDRVPCMIGISISPSLLAMMEDPLLMSRYERHLAKSIELSEKEMERNKADAHLLYLAGMYRDMFTDARALLETCGGRLSTVFRRLHLNGLVELMTTSATHALLPLLADRRLVSCQVRTGLDYFEDVFGFRPGGMWLPECGYYPGLDEVLADEGVRYFILESHGLENASVTPLLGVHAPLFTPSGVAAFGRDQASTKQVWSAREGFPGDPLYREFYRDIGHDLDFEYVRPYLSGDIRCDTGIKYYRITGPSAWKQPYDPNAARERAAQHAAEFLHSRVAQVEYLHSTTESMPIVVAPFDAELFGHWWFEGPQWLDFLIRKTVYDQEVVALTTPGAYLDRHPVHQTGVPSTSTWGHQGYFGVWMNGRTDWIYSQLSECGRRMKTLVERYARHGVDSLRRRVLNQCVRELFLAQSSDWPFIIYNGTAEEYAVRRVKDHVGRFAYLTEALEDGVVNEEYLAALEGIDNIFPNADYRQFLAD